MCRHRSGRRFLLEVAVWAGACVLIALLAVGARTVVQRHRVLTSPPPCVWLYRACGGPDEQRSDSIAVDFEGNTVIAGTFWDSADFGSVRLSCPNGAGSFIARYGADGDLLWAKALDTGRERPVSMVVATDRSANVFVAAGFGSSLVFDGVLLKTAGKGKLLLLKLDSTGEYTWAVGFGGPLGHAYPKDIATGPQGNIVIVGAFNGTVTFGDTSLTAHSPEVSDAFVAKVDANGNFTWALAGGSPRSGNCAYTVVLDRFRNVLVCGYFDPPVGTPIVAPKSDQEWDTCLLKVDPNGTALWAAYMPWGCATYYPRCVAIDLQRNILVTGSFKDKVTVGDRRLVSRGESDIFVSKITPEGHFLWTTQAGGKRIDAPGGIAVDSAGNVFLAGSFRSSARFGYTELRFAESGPMGRFAAALDPDGRFVWATSLDGNSVRVLGGIATDPVGNLLLTGWFAGQLRIGERTLLSQGYGDVFLAKFRARR